LGWVAVGGFGPRVTAIVGCTVRVGLVTEPVIAVSRRLELLKLERV
jgi:hypothetical protein